MRAPPLGRVSNTSSQTGSLHFRGVVPSSRHEAVTAESDVTVYAFQGCGMDWAAGGRLLTFVDAGKGSRDQGDGYVVSG